MRDINKLSNSSKIEKAWSVNHNMAHEPKSTEEATQRVIHILDARYKKADLQSVVDTNCPRVSRPDQNKLLDLLTKYEDLWWCTRWLEHRACFLWVKGWCQTTSWQSLPSPTHTHKETFTKELNRLCELGVLEWQPESEWASPSFIVPKKTKLCVFSVILEN